MADAGHNIVGVEEEVFLAAVARISRAKIDKEQADAAYSGARKAAKADGIKLGDLDMVMRLHDLGGDETRASFERMSYYAAWLGSPVGRQIDMFNDAAPGPDVMAEAYGKGTMAGVTGEPSTANPYDGNSPQGQKWLEGWHKGAEHFNAACDATNLSEASEPAPLGPGDDDDPRFDETDLPALGDGAGVKPFDADAEGVM